MTKYKRPPLALASNEETPPAIPQPQIVEEQKMIKKKTIDRTLRLPPAVYQLLRNLSHEEFRTMHSYYLEAIDRWMIERGLPSFAELDDTGRVS